MCNCISIVNLKLIEVHGPSVDVELVPTINIETGEIALSLQPLRFTHMQGKKKKRSHVTFNYCPFCGKKLGGLPVAKG
jgi:hypothetical protein